MATEMTIQEKIKAKLDDLELPKKVVQVYGSQIVITCFCEQSASKWASVLSKFCRIRSIIETNEDAIADDGESIFKKQIKVWRIFATTRTTELIPKKKGAIWGDLIEACKLDDRTPFEMSKIFCISLKRYDEIELGIVEPTESERAAMQLFIDDMREKHGEK